MIPRFAIPVLSLSLAAVLHAAGGYSWETAPARVLPQGDLEWTPEPFAFTPGSAVRYIDYDGGHDEADGTRAAPWKHHPWDEAATGKARAAIGSGIDTYARAAIGSGIDTYVFKGGVRYRGRLNVSESGAPDRPIRLTRDPAWGTGDADLVGSERVIGWTRGTSRADIPDGDKVWVADVDFLPRNVWLCEGPATTRIPLARTPNWTVTNPDDVKSGWYEWDMAGHKPFGNKEGNLHIAYDSVNITNDASYYENAILWTEWGWVMGGPFPVRVSKVDVANHALAFAGIWGGASRLIIAHNRYFIEDKPQYLDDPSGEF